ncbi:MAG: FtsW/RodA/SpoVE family cell cycle protein [Bacteroidetes bacterium]|nr:FtsW/RodA/SpoVE family cell cycle protein [Bacteroidota bacterium]
MTTPKIYVKGDRSIWIVVLLLSSISVLAVYSSTGKLAYTEQGGNTEHYLIKHAFTVLSGIFLMYMTHLFNYKVFSRLGQILLFIAVPLLAITLFTGTNLNQGSRWITLPIINLTFQSSDVAKLALIMYLARLLSRKQETIKDFKEGFIPLMIPIAIVCGLILPANFSTAAILFMTSLIILFIGRVNLKYILILVGSGIIAFSLFIVIALNMNLPGRIGTWKARVENFSKGDSQSNYQAEHAKIAIASGGVIGVGPGNSTQRNFLPQSYSDFIFAIILEEYGLFGGILLVLLYIILLYRIVSMLRYSPQTFATLLALGCGLMLVFQALINMAVAVNLFPVTGQPLPLVSMGGTSVWFTSISIGIILSVSRFCKKEKGGELETA